MPQFHLDVREGSCSTDLLDFSFLMTELQGSRPARRRVGASRGANFG
jgi:hypothetical protein